MNRHPSEPACGGTAALSRLSTPAKGGNTQSIETCFPEACKNPPLSARTEPGKLSNDVCMFTGHRILNHTKALDDALDDALQSLYQQGYRVFISGGAMGFDLIAARAVLRLRALRADAQLFMMLPCKDQSARYPAGQKQEHEAVLALADKVHYISEWYYDGCLFERNRRMVENANLCLCYLVSRKGGTAYTVSYAVQHGLAVINLAQHIKEGT